MQGMLHEKKMKEGAGEGSEMMWKKGRKEEKPRERRERGIQSEMKIEGGGQEDEDWEEYEWVGVGAQTEEKAYYL